LKRMAGLLESAPGETLIEIGPGHGELTRFILEAAPGDSRLIAVEKDPKLAQELRDRLPDPRLTIIEGDARRLLPTIFMDHSASAMKLAGNIPYYLSGYLFRLLGESPVKPILSVLTVQKEVAERLAARPPKMNRLAGSVQFWSVPKIITIIKSAEFNPPPGVDSAVVLLATKSGVGDGARYFKTLRRLFAQPRKTLLNNLSAGFGAPAKTALAERLSTAGFDPSSRPQNLAIEDIEKISSFF